MSRSETWLETLRKWSRLVNIKGMRLNAYILLGLNNIKNLDLKLECYRTPGLYPTQY